MNYAVIRTGGKQYKVNVGDTLTLDRIKSDEKSFTFEEVLLVVNDGKVTIGKPVVNGAKVEATLVENKRGDKIRVSRYKAKVRYRRTIGFRPELSIVKIEKIAFGGEKTAKKTDMPAKTALKTPKK